MFPQPVVFFHFHPKKKDTFWFSIYVLNVISRIMILSMGEKSSIFYAESRNGNTTNALNTVIIIQLVKVCRK